MIRNIDIGTLLRLLLLSSVSAENMKWGPHADLVDEVDKIQGRENNKMAVVMQGQDIRFECRVTFTTDPPKNIVWKIDGRITNDHEEQKEEKDEDDVHIKGHLKLSNITKDMDGKTVTCAYSKGRYGDSIEAILRVFSLNIEASKEACDECKDNVELVFKESLQKSPAESTVDKRIKAKISDLTKVEVKDIFANQSGYSVSAPASKILNNPDVTALTPTISVDGREVKCQCEREHTETRTDDGGASLYGLFAIIPAAMIVFLVYWVSPARGGSWGWRRQDDHGGSLQLPSS